ncbi:MAG TPA: FtsK/SpoIIIE domain-containing protein, partial [Anaerolineaceae bacterium]|nr:FtsK/SpoIIIE domain-containing protein [Anaerolineaceae bacterium]
DTSEYADIVGRGVPADLSNVPGRGFVRVGNMPLEFQTALSFNPDENDMDNMSKLNQMCIRMNEIWGNSWKGEKPSTIDTLQLRVSLERLMKEETYPTGKRLNILMGIDDRTLEAAYIDIERQGPHMVILGQPFSGKTTTLRTIIVSLAANYSPDTFAMVLIDYSRKLWKGSDHSLQELPHVLDVIDEVDQLDELLENVREECLDFEVHPKRRKLVILIDNYDSFSDESNRKKMQFFEDLSSLVRKYQTAGVFVIAAGSVAMMSTSDDLRKVITAPNFGIALMSADAVNRLNGKFPRSLADVELPMGRSFIVRSGITSMLQIATPYISDEEAETSMDNWIKTIVKKYPGEKSKWLRIPQEKSAEDAEPAEADQISTTQQSTSVTTSSVDLSKYNMKEVKQKLLEGGMTEDMLGALSPSDLVESYIALQSLDDDSLDDIEISDDDFPVVEDFDLDKDTNIAGLENDETPEE